MSAMVGQWRLEQRDPNFGDFLACRQVGWLMRTLMTSSKAEVEYKLDRDTFTKLTTTYGGRVSRYPMPTSGEFTPDKTLSGRPETGRIHEDGRGQMVQTMTFSDTGETAAVLNHRVSPDDNKLVVEMKCKDITCTAVYTKHSA